MFTMLSSILIELAQLIFKRGYFELNDIITNTCGVIVGIMLIHIKKRLFYKEGHFIC